MKNRWFPILIITCLIIGFKNNYQKTKVDNYEISELYGEWKIIEVESEYPEISKQHLGMNILKDSIEFYSGFFYFDMDSNSKVRKTKYYGNFTKYELKNDSFFIQNPKNQNWEFYWKIIKIENDTLELEYGENKKVFYTKLIYPKYSKTDFDQIIYSSSGCYGTCPILNISLNKNGEILYNGEAFVNKLGFYKSWIDSSQTNYIFEKFYKSNPLKLNTEYIANHTDDHSVITTYIKEGKILKTIHDYGKTVPSELIWAYIPLGNIYKNIQLEKISFEENFFIKFQYFTFEKNDLKLCIKKSETFFLFTELNKSKTTEIKFEPIYEISVDGNFRYLKVDPLVKNNKKYDITKITSDGRFFKFHFKKEKSITLDLGYNFVDKNFKPSDFKKEE